VHTAENQAEGVLNKKLLLCLILAATLVVAPLLARGFPFGFEIWLHVPSWIEVNHQWRQGILYPRWAGGAEEGYGEPRFIFYPPVSYFLGAALGFLLPWRFAPVAFIWIALVVAGLCMYRLAREYLGFGAAILAAVFYAANPNHLTMIYRRIALAELLASAVFPLVVLLTIRLGRTNGRNVISLALALSVICLTSAPAAVMVAYALALILIVVAIERRTMNVILQGVAAAALAVLLCAFYLLPAVFEQRWLQPVQIVHVWLIPEYNFLFNRKPHPYTSFNLLISLLAVSELALAAGAIALSAKLRRKWPEAWWAAVALSITSFLLMFPVGFFAWRAFSTPKLVAFPWQWLFLLNLAAAFLLAGAFEQSRRQRLTGLLVLLVPLFFFGGSVARMELRKEYFAQLTSIDPGNGGYYGGPEFAPRGVDLFKLHAGLPPVRVADESGGRDGASKDQAVGASHAIPQIQLRRWDAELKSFTVVAPAPTELAVRLLNYPAWQVELNGKAVPAPSMRDTGDTILPLSAGTTDVVFTFTRTWDRTLGFSISLVTLILLLAWRFTSRPQLRGARASMES
jgi:uncharacterized membrane protein